MMNPKRDAQADRARNGVGYSELRREGLCESRERHCQPPRTRSQFVATGCSQTQAVRDSWKEKPTATKEAVHFNQRLWTIFLDSLIQDKDRLPVPLRENLKTLGAFVMCETFSLVTKPQHKHFDNLININRRVATGLRNKH